MVPQHKSSARSSSRAFRDSSLPPESASREQSQSSTKTSSEKTVCPSLSCLLGFHLSRGSLAHGIYYILTAERFCDVVAATGFQRAHDHAVLVDGGTRHNFNVGKGLVNFLSRFNATFPGHHY